MAIRYIINAPALKRDIRKDPNAYEKAVRALLDPWATHTSAAIVMRLLGYWMVRTQFTRAEIVDRGIISRRHAYATEADFRAVFGIPVEDFDPSMLPKFLGMEPTPEGTPDPTTGDPSA